MMGAIGIDFDNPKDFSVVRLDEVHEKWVRTKQERHPLIPILECWQTNYATHPGEHVTTELKARPVITSIRMVNFKNFVDETLRLGPFTVVVGTNASGKSNIRDAFRFLHGIGRGYTLAEVVGGKWGAGGQQEWLPIRGAANEIARLAHRDARWLGSTFSFQVDLQIDGKSVNYSIEIAFDPRPLGFRVTGEALRVESRPLYETISIKDGAHWVRCADGAQIGFSPLQPVLTQLDPPRAAWPTGILQELTNLRVRSALADMRFLDLSPEHMRRRAFPGSPLGDRGENLPAVLEQICRDPGRATLLAGWLQELTPMDVKGFEFPRGENSMVDLMLCEKNGRRVSADSASDGTLRFLAVLAVIFGKDPPGLCFFEEIDTSIHPVRLHLLTDLIEHQAAKRNIQVITTTHAPTLLTVMEDATFENTSVVCRLEDTADAIIRPIVRLPNAHELRREQGLGRLHESGWLETALSFTEQNDEEGT